MTSLKIGDTLKVFYLDWVNNYLSTERMAQDYGLTDDQCRKLIDLSRDYYNSSLMD